MALTMTDYLTARGWLSLVEREALKAAAMYAAACFTHVTPPIFVNIGVEYGASLHCLRAGSPDATIVGVDLDTSKMEGAVIAELIQGDSNDKAVAQSVRNDIGLLFIDGGHDQETVERDILLWSPKVNPWGLMIFHDYSPQTMHAGVVAAVNAWEAGSHDTWTFMQQYDTLRVYRKKL